MTRRELLAAALASLAVPLVPMGVDGGGFFRYVPLPDPGEWWDVYFWDDEDGRRRWTVNGTEHAEGTVRPYVEIAQRLRVCGTDGWLVTCDVDARGERGVVGRVSLRPGAKLSSIEDGVRFVQVSWKRPSAFDTEPPDRPANLVAYDDWRCA